MSSGYTEYRLRLKQQEYEDKRKDFLNLVGREYDTDNFETNAIQLLLTMNALKETINELQLNVSAIEEL